jgi:hypothetical protein
LPRKNIFFAFGKAKFGPKAGNLGFLGCFGLVLPLGLIGYIMMDYYLVRLL